MSWVKYADNEIMHSQLFVNIETGEKRQVDSKGRVYIYNIKTEMWEHDDV